MEREKTKGLVKRYDIPGTTISEVGGVSKSNVSEYLHNRAVSARDCEKIEETVTALALIVAAIREYSGFRPDLRDIPSIKAAVAELRLIQEVNEVHSDLLDGLRAMAVPNGLH